MKLFRIKRTTRLENRYTTKMGNLVTKVTYIKKFFLFFPLRTLHKYRETYYGKVKSCKSCDLAA